MRLVMSTVSAIALSCAVIAAQDRPQTSTGTTQTATTPQSATTAQTPQTTTGAQRNTVTYTGCLQAGSGAAGATTTTAQTTSPASYILTNVMPAAASTTGTAGATTTGTAGTAAAASSFVLEPAASVNLTPHVGHRVSVTGTIQPMSMGAGGGATTGLTNREDGTTGRAGAAGATTTAAARPGGMAPHFQVSSVQMISTDCSAK